MPGHLLTLIATTPSTLGAMPDTALESLCVVPGKYCWVLYVDAIVRACIIMTFWHHNDIFGIEMAFLASE